MDEIGCLVAFFAVCTLGRDYMNKKGSVITPTYGWHLLSFVAIRLPIRGRKVARWWGSL
jgi:TRAP-type C4-dicarboxylate transport system permease small subunit